MGGKVFSVEDGYTENGSATPLVFQSQYEDCGNPDREKTWADLVLNHNTQGVTLNVDIRRNKNADAFTLTTINSVAMTRTVIPMLYPAGYGTVALRGKPIEAFNLAVRISGNAPTGGTPAVIDGPIILHYYLKPRAVSQWDSGPTDHGITGPKMVDALEIDMDGLSGTLFLQSDIPGGLLAERTAGGLGITVPSTTGRQVQRIILPSAVLGRIYRYQMNFPSPSIVYRVRFRVVPIGVFADGAFGDSWYTEPIAA